VGRVAIEGEDWRGTLLEAETGATLDPGTRVVVLQVDGSTLVVEREVPEP
jgi:membrane protein implicated in regulation of membrane protease activity